MPHEEIAISTPGRICLFGEHQDYLMLPVIAVAISLRLTIRGTRHAGPEVHLSLPDIGSSEIMHLNNGLAYTRERDYFRSGIRVMKRHGFTFSEGVNCAVHGSIPINAGTSSSTALVVSWIHFLGLASDQRTLLSPMHCAHIAHEAEVTEFGEPGGMMDHYSTALGGTIMIDFTPSFRIRRVSLPAIPIVLGNSREPKDTRKILARVKNRMIAIAADLSLGRNSRSLEGLTPESAQKLKGRLSSDDFALLAATVDNHRLTRAAATILESARPDMSGLANLMNLHQDNLRNILHISTPKIDRMIDASLAAGAISAKINGSGGGGCMFALAPGCAEQVAESIEREGGTAYVVSVDTGTKMDSGVIL